MRTKIAAITGHLAMFQMLHRGVAEADRPGDRVDHRPGQHQAEREHGHDQDDHHQRHRSCSGRSFQKGRPSGSRR